MRCRVIYQQSNWGLADVTPRIRVVIPEPVIVQSSFRVLVLPLILERNKRGWAFSLPPVDVQLLFPYIVALFVVGLQGRAEVVGDDGETLTVGYKLGGRHERVLFKQPSYYTFFRFFRPFVQWYVAVPNEVRGGSCKGFSDATAKGVVGKRHFFAVGTDNAGEHAVALPIVTPARAEGAETDAQFGFELLLIDRGDDVAVPRQLLKFLEHEVALAVVVVEVFAVFDQPATGIFGGGNVTPIQ